MADMQSGETYADGQTVNASRLNNQTNGATILPAFVSAKGAVTGQTTDFLLLFQTSSSLLKKITVANLFATGGVVTSVGLTMPTGFTVVGSPITSSGTLAVTLANQTSNKALASPADGSSGAPTFRARDPRDNRYSLFTIPSTTIDWNLSYMYAKALTGDTTFSFSNTADGAEIFVIIANAGHHVHWPAVVWPGGVVPDPTTGINIFRFIRAAGQVAGKLDFENLS